MNVQLKDKIAERISQEQTFSSKISDATRKKSTLDNLTTQLRETTKEHRQIQFELNNTQTKVQDTQTKINSINLAYVFQVQHL